MAEEHPEVSTENLKKTLVKPVPKKKKDKKSNYGGFNLENPFSRDKKHRPTKEEMGNKLFKESTDVKEIEEALAHWLDMAFMAGEKAAQEKNTETDYTKLIGAMAIGFTLGFMLIKSGLLPA